MQYFNYNKLTKVISFYRGVLFNVFFEITHLATGIYNKFQKEQD